MSKPLTLKLLKFYWGEKKSLQNSKPRVENEHFSIVKIPSIEHQLYKNPSCTSYRFFTAFWLLWAADTAPLAWIKQLWIFVAWRGKNGGSNLINKSEKVFCVLYLELAKIPLRYDCWVRKSVQLMMMIFFESAAKKVPPLRFLDWRVCIRVTAWHLLTFSYKSWQAVNSHPWLMCV